MAADARHTLDALSLGAVVEAPSRGQRMVIASTRGPGLAAVDVIGEVVRDYGWELVASCMQSLTVERWPQLPESLSATLDGRLVLDQVSTWDEARRHLLRSEGYLGGGGDLEASLRHAHLKPPNP